MARSRLHDRTRDLLRNRPKPLTLQTLAERASVTQRWLEQFSQDKIKSPAVDKVERLYNALAEKPLNLEQP